LLNRLKALVEKLAEKVNAPGDTSEARLGAVEDRVNEVALHRVRLGTTLGLAAMSTHTGVDYSMRPRGFYGGMPEDSTTSRSLWSASTATAMPLPTPFTPSLC
jgi:hypothetical protein